MKSLGIRVIHSSAYNCQSMGPVERSVRTLKDMLNKHLNKLQLSENIYAIICKEDGEKGSGMTRFMGRGTRGNLPNSWNKAVDWRKQMELRGEEREKRVKAKKRTVGKKETFEEGEKDLLQNLKPKKWDIEGIVQNSKIS